MPFFYSSCQSKWGSKYLEQAIDYVCKVQHLLSPLNKIRILEGSFINTKGGIGNNIEADLVQEHSVRDQKVLIKGLGANKSDHAISVVTAAAPAITNICQNFDKTLNISQGSVRHTKKSSEMDRQVIRDVCRNIRPFKVQPGRKCPGFEKVKKH